MKRQENQGFTLVEMLIVLFLVGVLAGIIFVSIGNQRKKAQINSALQTAKSVHAITQSCYFEISMINLPNDVQNPSNEICSGSKTVWPEIAPNECQYSLIGGTSDHYYELECLEYEKKIRCGIRSGEICEELDI